MQKLLEELKTTLQSDERLIIDGKLVKNKIVELALAMDEGLIVLLLDNEAIKKRFFKDISGVLVFDKVAFQSFVSNKQFLPDSYTAFKNKIGLTANGEYLTESKEVVLAWPYKDCVLEGGQTKEDEKRKEIFWNETLASDEIDRLFTPKVFTNFKQYNKDGEHEVENISLDDNLIIKGNNLLALCSLKKQYDGKVKLIYIDPPYNTGSDSFGYNDSFNHSTWLTFMRNRLEMAIGLLRDDGFIFISCDDNEQAYLKILCDEIFGKENFFSHIIVQSNKRGQTYKQISKTHEYILIYSKSKFAEINELEKEKEFDIFDDIGGYELRELRNRNPKFGRFNRPNLFYPIYVDLSIKDKDGLHPVSLEKEENYSLEVLPLNSLGNESCWRWGKDKSIDNSGINTRKTTLVAKEKTTGQFGIYEKYRKQTYKAKTIWFEKEVISEQGTKELGKLNLSDKFNFPKPTHLIKKVIQLGSDKDSIILDFFAGSGTTAQAVLDINKADGGKRKFILIEQLNYVEEVTVERIKHVLRNNENDSSFIYCELTQHNANIVDKIEQASTTETLKSIWHEIENSDFISYKINPETINENIHVFEGLSLEEQKQFLIAVLDKNQLYVNYSEIGDEDYKISEADKKLNQQFYGEA